MYWKLGEFQELKAFWKNYLFCFRIGKMNEITYFWTYAQYKAKHGKTRKSVTGNVEFSVRYTCFSRNFMKIMKNFICSCAWKHHLIVQIECKRDQNNRNFIIFIIVIFTSGISMRTGYELRDTRYIQKQQFNLYRKSVKYINEKGLEKYHHHHYYHYIGRER